MARVERAGYVQRQRERETRWAQEGGTRGGPVTVRDLKTGKVKRIEPARSSRHSGKRTASL